MTTPAELPCVSVVIPVYNQGQFLGSAVDSVLAQSYGNLEVLVVDDGSTDSTPDVIRTYGSRIVGLLQPHSGASAALNHGIRSSSGQYVCWLSSDDEYLPGKIERQVAEFKDSPELALSFTGFQLIDTTGRVYRRLAHISLRHPDPYVAVFWRDPINGTTVMMRRSVFDDLGFFDESLVADVDGDMWLRVAQRYPMREVPEVLASYRMHSGALSANRTLMRDSVTLVRMKGIQDGTLERRLVAHDPDAASRVLASMALDYAVTGYPILGQRLLVLSRTLGRALPRQMLAAAAVRAVSWERPYEAAIEAWRGIRVIAGRRPNTRRPHQR